MPAERSSVRDAFLPFNTPLEGVEYNLYADIKGLVTIGVGNLVDPVELALDLPLRTPDGSMASRADIAAEWDRVKHDPQAARQGASYAEQITALRLDQDGLRAIVEAKLDQVAGAMAGRFPGFSSWPANAQLAVLSWAWATGGGGFPNLAASLDAEDWSTASDEIRIDETGNPGVALRNDRNRTLLLAAAAGSGPDEISLDVVHVALPPVPPPGDLATLPVSSGGSSSTAIAVAKQTGKVLLGIGLVAAAIFGGRYAYKKLREKNADNILLEL
jgi:hypothetical protein